MLSGALLVSACGATSTESITGPSADKCPVAVTAPSAALESGGAAAAITVTTQPECAWTAAAEAAWITDVAPAQGQGNGRVEFRVAQNPNGSTREGAVIVNGQRVVVRQNGAPCAVTAAVSASAFAATGGSGTASVTTPAGCGWSVSVSQPWITVSPASGAGTATVNFTVAPNASGPRSGTMTVGGITFTLNQAGVSSPAPGPSPAPAPPISPTCTLTLQPALASTSAAGGTGSVVITTAAGCAWTASSGVPWLTITTPTSGNGSGSFGYSVAANASTSARSGSVTVGGATFTVNQAGASGTACTITLNPTGRAVAASATTGSTVAVSAPSGCPWTSASNAQWLTITSGASGSGNGSVAFNVAANTGPGRTGTLTIGGQTFTVDQAGTCTYSINPSSREFDKDGGTGSVAVTAPNGCAWTASSGAGFIAITGGQSGSGNGTVTYTVASYNGNGNRNGTMTIAGQTFTVSQKK